MCEFDPLRDDGKIMEHVLKKAGIKVKSDYYKGYPHYFWIFPSISDGQKFVQNVITGIHFVLGA
jgi:versiconal hemiacetal acetate esterase